MIRLLPFWGCLVNPIKATCASANFAVGIVTYSLKAPFIILRPHSNCCGPALSFLKMVLVVWRVKCTPNLDLDAPLPLFAHARLILLFGGSLSLYIYIYVYICIYIYIDIGGTLMSQTPHMPAAQVLCGGWGTLRYILDPKI